MLGYFYQEPFTGVVLLHIPAQPDSAWVSQLFLYPKNTLGASLKASCLHCAMSQHPQVAADSVKTTQLRGYKSGRLC